MATAVRRTPPTTFAQLALSITDTSRSNPVMMTPFTGSAPLALMPSNIRFALETAILMTRMAVDGVHPENVRNGSATVPHFATHLDIDLINHPTGRALGLQSLITTTRRRR